MEGFIKTCQRQAALNPEHRNLISILVGNLHDIKKQIKDNVTGRVDQAVMSFKLQTNYLRN